MLHSYDYISLFLGKPFLLATSKLCIVTKNDTCMDRLST